MSPKALQSTLIRRTDSRVGRNAASEETATSPRISLGRPAKGLPPDDALLRWGDAAAVERLRVLIGPDASDAPLYKLFWASVTSREGRELREAAEAPFYEGLKRGLLAAQGIPDFGDHREVIDKDLWELLWINWEFQEVVGDGRSFRSPEFFHVDAIPRNVREIPDWLVPEFEHDPEYRHVVLRGLEFRFGRLQGKVVALLHKAWLEGHAWASGKRVLDQAGANSEHMSDLFDTQPNWRVLIESNKRGDYRLTLG